MVEMISNYIFFILGTFSGPIVIHVNTDEQLKGISQSGIAKNSLQAIEFATSGLENGFKLDYQFTNNCPDVWIVWSIKLLYEYYW